MLLLSPYTFQFFKKYFAKVQNKSILLFLQFRVYHFNIYILQKYAVFTTEILTTFAKIFIMNSDKITILKVLSKFYSLDVWYNVSFNELSKETGLTKEKLDTALNELEMEHFIDQAVLEKSDAFRLRLNKVD